jgi:hypothetical protein
MTGGAMQAEELETTPKRIVSFTNGTRITGELSGKLNVNNWMGALIYPLKKSAA